MKHVRKIRIRFSLRTLLAVMLCVSIFLAIFVLQVVVPSQQEHRRIAMISESVPDAQVFTEPKGQFAIRHLLGDRFSERAVHVHLSDPAVTDAWISEKLTQLRHIETLSILSSNVTDKGLAEISRLPSLKSLNLVNTRISESAFYKFRKSKPYSVVHLSTKLPDGTFIRLPRLKKTDGAE